MSDNCAVMCLIDDERVELARRANVSLLPDMPPVRWQAIYFNEVHLAQGKLFLSKVRAKLEETGQIDEAAVTRTLQDRIFTGSPLFTGEGSGVAMVALIEHAGHPFLELQGFLKNGVRSFVMTPIAATSTDEAVRISSHRYHEQMAEAQL